MTNSRMSRIEERQSKRQLILIILAIIAILVLIYNFGVPLLIRTAIFFSSFNTVSKFKPDKDTTSPLAPVLFPTLSATNSAEIKIEGYAEAETELKLFLNGEEVKKILLGNDGNFSFSDILLTEGDNSIYATASDETGNESSRSKKINVVYKKQAPKLEISQPQEGQTFGKNDIKIKVTGKTDPGTNITINDRFVSVTDDGSFAFEINLTAGENKILIIATDQAGNQTRLERKVIYSEQ